MGKLRTGEPKLSYFELNDIVGEAKNWVNLFRKFELQIPAYQQKAI